MGKSGYTCVRQVFCWLNLITWVSGCLMLAGGIYLRVCYPGRSTLLPHLWWAGADTLLIAVGCVCFLAAFFGCCGAWVQSRCMLVTYFSLVVIILCTEFIGASLIFVFRDSIGFHVKTQLQKSLQTHYNVTDNNLVPIWDHLQEELKCCGVHNYEDWYQIESWPLERRVPDSCCKVQGLGRERCGSRGEQSQWWEEGCASKLQVWLVERLHFGAIIAFLIAFKQLFGLISSMILFCTVKHKRNSRTYKSYQPAS